MTQWHPLFVRLLRPIVEDWYDIETNVAVGDAPREADLLLLRRTHKAEPPFAIVWKYLAPWNVLEYKGPSASARINDLRLLTELGLGIYRKVNEERANQKQARVAAVDISFWYIRHDLGRRFLKGAQTLLGTNPLERIAAGIWRCRLFDHLIYLVDGQALPFGRESFPLQFLHTQAPDWDKAAAELLAGDTVLQKSCGSMISTLHPGLVQEIIAMARARNNWSNADLQPLIELMGGMDKVIRQLGRKRVIDEIGVKGMLEEMGAKRVVEEMGAKRVVEEMTPDELFASLSPAQRRELKRRLLK